MFVLAALPGDEDGAGLTSSSDFSGSGRCHLVSQEIKGGSEYQNTGTDQGQDVTDHAHATSPGNCRAS